MRLLFFFALLSLFLLPAYSEFELRSLTVQVDVMDDGTAVVQERIELFLTTRSSVELYESGLSINDLATWRERIKSKDIRVHFNTGVVDVRNIRIRPQPISRCISVEDYRSNCFALLIFDYKVYPFYENGTAKENTGLFNTLNYKPRTTKFSINREALSF